MMTWIRPTAAGIVCTIYKLMYVAHSTKHWCKHVWSPQHSAAVNCHCVHLKCAPGFTVSFYELICADDWVFHNL
jgi:hypothetical protein